MDSWQMGNQLPVAFIIELFNGCLKTDLKDVAIQWNFLINRMVSVIVSTSSVWLGFDTTLDLAN